MQAAHTSGSANSHSTTTKSVASLEKLIREHASGSMDTLDDFAKYWNEFDGIARHLIEGKVISKAERDLYFWAGLPHVTRKSIAQQLATTDLSYHERLIPTWRDAIQAGRLTFQDLSGNTPSNQDKDIDKLVRTLHGLNVDDSNYAVAYARLLVAAPTVADRIPPPSRWTRSPVVGSHLSVPRSPPPTPVLQSSTGTPYRQAVRRVQSFVSYQLCPNCVDQHALHRHHTS